MLLAILALAAAEPAAPVKPVSAQALFDAANAASEAGRWADAVISFEAIEARLGGKGNSRVIATVLVRKGIALARLGKGGQARVAITKGLASLPTDADLRVDRYGALVELARIAESENDFVAMRAPLAEAQTLADGDSERLTVAVLGARATMFDADDAALRYADQASALIATMAGVTKDKRGELRTLRARVLLNRGEHKAAYDELKKALGEQGGLSMKVTQGDIATRSDLGIAALLNKDQENARLYLAYTGAGQSESPFGTAARMEPPPCGGVADLKPDDVAIVQFGLLDDGSVAYATPIYTSRRTSAAATEFASAVLNWSWDPAAMKSIKPFFRFATRVELRCSTASERPPVTAQIYADARPWFNGLAGVLPPDPQGLPWKEWAIAQTKALEDADRAGDTRLIGPLLAMIARNPTVPIDRRRSAIKRFRALPGYASVPVAVRAVVASISATIGVEGSRDAGLPIREALAERDIAADAQASSALRVMLADADPRRATAPATIALLTQVADDSRLAKTDAMRVAALVRLANAQARTGAIDAARASYEKTGLDAQSCALVDATPALRSSGADYTDFPVDAMRWGFSGWVRLEFDVEANGQTKAQRAIVAYPPFVFRDAATTMAKRFRYTQSYRPAGGPGCGGAQNNVVFRMP